MTLNTSYMGCSLNQGGPISKIDFLALERRSGLWYFTWPGSLALLTLRPHSLLFSRFCVARYYPPAPFPPPVVNFPTVKGGFTPEGPRTIRLN